MLHRSKDLYLGGPKKKKSFFRVLAAVLTLTMIGLVLLAILTQRESDRLMEMPAMPVPAVSANVLPEYRNASFQSVDPGIQLTGWLFPAVGMPRGTVILVHSYGQNRLPFGIATASLFRALTENGFQVLSFDLRRSGSSGGDRQSFGYAEWEDVLAAMTYSWRVSGADSFILFGIGSGVTASLLAYEQLPEDETVKAKWLADGNGLQRQLASLPFTRASVAGFVLDGALTHSDLYIQEAVRQDDPFLPAVLERTVPAAVRLSSGLAENLFLPGRLTRISRPMLLLVQEEAGSLGPAVTLPAAKERERLFPQLTWVWESEAKSLLGALGDDPEGYTGAVLEYLEAVY